MNWTNALGLCPRCEAPADDGQMVCLRCGLRLVEPPYRESKIPPELDTTVLQPVAVSHKRESKLPALLVMCAVVVLAAGMVLAGANRNDATAQATSQNPTATVVRHAPTPATPTARLTRTPLSDSLPPTRTSTPLPPTPTLTPPPTDTPAPPTLTPAPTDTPLPPTPAPTTESQAVEPAKTLPGVGNYVNGFNGWMVKLDGIGSRPVLWSPAPDTMHQSQGSFWLAYVVYRNDSSTPRSLGATLDFALKGSDGQVYAEYSDRGRDPQRKKIADAMHANPLDYTVAPGQRTATVLVFDLPPGVAPVRLLGRLLDGDNLSPNWQVAWELGKAP